jgi:hypothetical protein
MKAHDVESVGCPAADRNLGFLCCCSSLCPARKPGEPDEYVHVPVGARPRPRSGSAAVMLLEEPEDECAGERRNAY